MNDITIKEVDKVCEYHKDDNRTVDYLKENWKGGITIFEYIRIGHHLSWTLFTRDLGRYKYFVKSYNRCLEELFAVELKSICKSIDKLKDSGLLGYSVNVNLYDATDIFKSGRFRFETTLEDTIYNEFIDYLGENNVLRQQKLKHGKSDLIINLDTKTYVVELKKDKAKPIDVFQAKMYSFDNDLYVPVLIASEVSEDIYEIGKKLGVECYEYSLVGFYDQDVYTDLYINHGKEPDSEFSEFLFKVNIDEGCNIDFNYKNKKSADEVVNEMINKLKSISKGGI